MRSFTWASATCALLFAFFSEGGKRSAEVSRKNIVEILVGSQSPFGCDHQNPDYSLSANHVSVPQEFVHGRLLSRLESPGVDGTTGNLRAADLWQSHRLSLTLRCP